MNKDSSLNSRREFLKEFDLVHFNAAEFELLRERKFDKDSMLRAVRHLSECRKCCRLASVLTEQKIRNALAGTPYEKAGIVEQTVNYYFQTLKRR